MKCGPHMNSTPAPAVGPPSLCVFENATPGIGGPERALKLTLPVAAPAFAYQSQLPGAYPTRRVKVSRSCSLVVKLSAGCCSERPDEGLAQIRPIASEFGADDPWTGLKVIADLTA